MNKVLQDYYEIKKEFDKKLGSLTESCDAIVKVIVSCFGVKDFWWEYPALNPQNLYDNIFSCYISCQKNLYGYEDGFPISFFDMNRQEIKDYIQKEIAEIKEKERIKKEKAKLARERRKQEKENAKKKLTKSELKALLG